MNILALLLLIVSGLALLIAAPLAIFVPYRAFDDTERPILVFLLLAMCVAVPLVMAWCVYNAWQFFQSGNYDSSVQYSVFPAGGLIVFLIIVAIATKINSKS